MMGGVHEPLRVKARTGKPRLRHAVTHKAPVLPLAPKMAMGLEEEEEEEEEEPPPAAALAIPGGRKIPPTPTVVTAVAAWEKTSRRLKVFVDSWGTFDDDPVDLRCKPPTLCIERSTTTAVAYSRRAVSGLILLLLVVGR